jgi:tetratricopeptide (TPR) repeat protein
VNPPKKEQLLNEAVGRPSDRPADPGGRGVIVGVCVLLAVAVFLVFGQTLRYDFVNYDDDQYFYANPQVQHGLTWSGVAWAFQTTYAANWHPLTWLSLMLDAQLFGAGSMGPHLTNVLLHAANTVLLFLLLRRLSGTYWRSAFVAALFGLHPLHVESVAWVAERKDVLSGLFFLLTLLMYARYVEQSKAQSPKSRVFYGLALLFFALGLMCKPMLVTVPFVLLLLDYWPLKRFGLSTFNSDESRAGPQLSTKRALRLVLEKFPFFVLSTASCVVTFLAQRQAIEPIERLPISQRIGNALVSYIAYLGQTFYPAKLAIFYPHPEKGPPLLGITLALILLAGISAGVLAWWRVRPYLLVGWLWYLGMLVPVIGLVQVGEQARADRYTYLPLIGVFIMLAWGARDLFSSWRYRRPVLGITAFIGIAVLMVCASIQTSYWRNSESLWTHTLACTSRNYVGHNNLGIVFAKRGQSAQAMEHYQKALEIKPGYMDAHNNLGIMLAGQGRAAEAMEHYQTALEIKPDFAEAHYNLGNLLAQQGRSTEAIEHFQKALEIKPDSPKVHYRLALALKNQGRFKAAIAHYQKVLELEPRHMLAQNALAWLLATCPENSLRNGEKAVELAQQAEQLSGGRHPEILDTLAAAYAEAGRFPDAVETAERALHLASNQSNTVLADDIRTRLKLYETNSPFHEKP